MNFVLLDSPHAHSPNAKVVVTSTVHLIDMLDGVVSGLFDGAIVGIDTLAQCDVKSRDLYILDIPGCDDMDFPEGPGYLGYGTPLQKVPVPFCAVICKKSYPNKELLIQEAEKISWSL